MSRSTVKKTYVSYYGQPATCKHCTSGLHAGMTCAENKKLVVQKVDLNKRLKQAQSYAGVVGGASVSSQGQGGRVSGEEAAAALMPVFTTLETIRNLGKTVSQPQEKEAAVEELTKPPLEETNTTEAVPADTVPISSDASGTAVVKATAPKALEVDAHKSNSTTENVEIANTIGQEVQGTPAKKTESTELGCTTITPPNCVPSSSYSESELAQRVEFKVPNPPDMVISDNEAEKYRDDDTDISDTSTTDMGHDGDGYTCVKRKRGRPKKVRTQ